MFTPRKTLALNELGRIHGLEPGIRTSPTSHELQPCRVGSVWPYRYFHCKQTLPIRKCYVGHAQLQRLCSPRTLLRGEQALCWLQLPSPAAGSSAARPTADGNAGSVLNTGIVLWLFCTQYSLTTNHIVFASY